MIGKQDNESNNADEVGYATAALVAAGCATGAVAVSAGGAVASAVAVPFVSFAVQSREMWPAWPHL